MVLAKGGLTIARMFVCVAVSYITSVYFPEFYKKRHMREAGAKLLSYGLEKDFKAFMQHGRARLYYQKKNCHA